MFDLEKKVKKLEDDVAGRDTLIKEIREEIKQARSEVNESTRLVRYWQKEIAHLKDVGKKHVPRNGVDIAWGKPTAAELKAAGATFVVRYYSHDESKNLTRSEAEDYSHAGLDILTVWEATQYAPLNGFDQGVLDAKAALICSEATGQPANSPIYFAVDFNPHTPEEFEKIAGYFRGVKDVLGNDRTGVYGGLSTIHFAVARNLAKFLWQTLAWSGGVWNPHAQLRQVRNGVQVSGVETDIDTAVSANFGQWKV